MNRMPERAKTRADVVVASLDYHTRATVVCLNEVLTLKRGGMGDHKRHPDSVFDFLFLEKCDSNKVTPFYFLYYHILPFYIPDKSTRDCTAVYSSAVVLSEAVCCFSEGPASACSPQALTLCPAP